MKFKIYNDILIYPILFDILLLSKNKQREIKMIIFCIIILLWLTEGILGIIHSKDNRFNWEMLVFLMIIPMIPIVAGLLL